MRYEFFDRTAVRFRAGWVATGHTADDQAETVIQRLLRGTGIRGLAGITDGRDGLLKASRVPLLRPLLRVERREIVDYLQSLDQPWREDGSNADSKFTRNRIRREILPLLKTVSPALVPLLGGLAEQATEVQSLLDELAESALEEVLVNGGERGTVRVLRLAAVPANDLIRREMFRLLWRNANWPLDGMTRGHWKRLSALCDGTERSEHFPGRIRVERQAKTIVIETG